MRKLLLFVLLLGAAFELQAQSPEKLPIPTRESFFQESYTEGGTYVEVRITERIYGDTLALEQLPVRDTLPAPRVDTLEHMPADSLVVHATQEPLSLSADTLASLSAEPQPAVKVRKRQGRFMPMSRRMDRNAEKNIFIYKGEVLMGLTASYGSLTSDDSDFYLLIEHVNADAYMTTFKPYVGYAYRNNRAVGVRFGYKRISADLDNLGFNLGEHNDMSGSLSDVGYMSDMFTYGIFHRNYVGLDRRGRFGVFADVEAMVTLGDSTFEMIQEGERKLTDSRNFKAELTFNPGMVVYVFPNVSAQVSFGLGGIYYSKINQYDDQGVKSGSRDASKMRFRLNLAEINIGFTFHLWNHNKE